MNRGYTSEQRLTGMVSNCFRKQLITDHLFAIEKCKNKKAIKYFALCYDLFVKPGWQCFSCFCDQESRVYCGEMQPEALEPSRLLSKMQTSFAKKLVRQQKVSRKWLYSSLPGIFSQSIKSQAGKKSFWMTSIVVVDSFYTLHAP